MSENPIASSNIINCNEQFAARRLAHVRELLVKSLELLRNTARPATIVATVAAIVLAGSSMRAVSAELVGTVGRIIDGDTFTLCAKRAGIRPWRFSKNPRCHRIRICGIDAPESSEPGGAPATNALSSLIAGKSIRCLPVGDGSVCDGRSQPTSYNRIVAQCWIGTLDIASEMVRHGQACDWRKFSGGHYATIPGARSCRK